MNRTPTAKASAQIAAAHQPRAASDAAMALPRPGPPTSRPRGIPASAEAETTTMAVAQQVQRIATRSTNRCAGKDPASIRPSSRGVAVVTIQMSAPVHAAPASVAIQWPSKRAMLVTVPGSAMPAAANR